MFPLLTGFSIFCIANPRSADFTRIFGGSNGNEGLGLLSICLDWQYISPSTSASKLICVTHTSAMTSLQSHDDSSESIVFFSHRMYIVHVGIYARLEFDFVPISRPVFSRVVFTAVFYMNIWNSKSFPFVCTILPLTTRFCA